MVQGKPVMLGNPSVPGITDGVPTPCPTLMVAYPGQIQVIATTHSPVVLQWLGDEALRNAIVFGRIPEHEGTIMRRLGDLPYFNEVVEKAGIDELFTTGWLEMAL